MARYLGWARATLSHRKTTAVAASLFFVLAMVLIRVISTAFLPAQDKAQSTVTLRLAPGSTLADTAAQARRASTLLHTLPEVHSVFVSAGTATSGGGAMGTSPSADVTRATLTVDLVPRGEREQRQSQVEARMRELLRSLPGVRISVGSGMSGESLSVTLAGDDPQALASAAAKAEEQLRTL